VTPFETVSATTVVQQLTTSSQRETGTASIQLENKNSVRNTQRACRQDELIGGKPSVPK
jgi:hypothetical protein